MLIWKECEQPGNNTQLEICEEKLSLSDVMKKLKEALIVYAPHLVRKEWLSQTRSIDLNTIPRNTILLFTDFSAQMDLLPNKTDNCHVASHAVLDIFFALRKTGKVNLSNGETIDFINTDLWYGFGGTIERGKKKDHLFHNSMLIYLLEFYIKNDRDLNRVVV